MSTDQPQTLVRYSMLSHAGDLTVGSGRHTSVGLVDGTLSEAMERVLRYRRVSAHVVGDRVIDYGGWGTGLCEYHWQFSSPDTDPDTLTPPWCEDGTATPWLTGDNHLINPPETHQLALL